MTQSLTHILCVDDEDDILSIVKLCLEDLGGIKTTCLSDVARAIDEIATINPDMLLLDVMMPRINGVSAIRLFREKQADKAMPIVLMTARVQPNEVQEYLDNGANGVIAKPFDPMTLVDEIKKIWDNLDGKR